MTEYRIRVSNLGREEWWHAVDVYFEDPPGCSIDEDKLRRIDAGSMNDTLATSALAWLSAKYPPYDWKLIKQVTVTEDLCVLPGKAL
jgi:hypothetical protein